jgi:hypothetical protein
MSGYELPAISNWHNVTSNISQKKPIKRIENLNVEDVNLEKPNRNSNSKIKKEHIII